ncbi:hypothetical protein CRYUN_Cryun08bG0067700 [Craigia yunnanensis]
MVLFQDSNHLLNIYVKSKNLSHARKLFDEMSQRDVRTWTILVSTFARVGSNGIVLELFEDMQNEGIKPNQFTLSSVLKCCSSLSELRIGKGVHGWTLRNGVAFDVVLENSLLDFYVKCEDFGSAKWLFELMEERNSVTWNIMIGAHLNTGDVYKELGKQIHGRVLTLGIEVDGFVRNSLIDMFCKCGKMEMALKVFEKMNMDIGRKENSIEEIVS